MKLQDFTENKKTELAIHGTGINVTVKKEIKWRSKETKKVTAIIPVKAKVHVWFSSKYAGAILIQYQDFVKSWKTKYAYQYLTGIQKPPTINTLYKRNSTGIDRTVTGKKIEPDSFSDEDGSPSWTLVFGIL